MDESKQPSNPGYGEIVELDKDGEKRNYVTSNELVVDAWKASCNAYKCKDFYKKEFKRDVVFIAFSSSEKSADLVMTETEFGECNINSGNQQFECMHDSDAEHPKPALVRKSFLDRFLCMLERSSLQREVLQAQTDQKTMVFTGHSFGGAIATLWELWALGKHHEKVPMCITFGCPLVGDKTLAKAVEREKWSSYFCHIVLKHDIVPRICFSSLISPSISKALDHLLPYWHHSMRNRAESEQPVQDSSHPLSKEDSHNFIKRVIADASLILHFETAALNVGPTNVVGGAVNDLIKMSPYRPFGCYVFYSSSGTACCIEDTNEALQMLYFALGSSKLSGASIMEHIDYGKTIEHIDKSSGHLALHSKVEKSAKSSSGKVAMALQLESMGIGDQNVQAWLGFKVVEDNKQKVAKNMAEQVAKLDKIQSCMADLELYKLSCEGPDLTGYCDCCKTQKSSVADLELHNSSCERPDLPGYYDCFKTKKNDPYLKANKRRLKLAAFWDRIIELVEKQELPEDFQTQEKWINAGTEYRLLVEPLDIAHYYRHGKHEDIGHYLSHGRPRRYKFLERWLKEEEKRKGEKEPRKRTYPPSLTKDSCFWARVEEARYCFTNEKNESYSIEKVNGFGELVKGMIEGYEISADVFSEKSSFMKWWNNFIDSVSEDFPLHEFMESDKLKAYTKQID